MTEIYMPRLSDTMEEGVISSWRKQVGDKVAPGEVLVEIETDKAVMEYEAYEEGFLVKRSVSEGDTVPIGAVIGVLGDSPDASPEESGSEGGAQESRSEPPAQESQPESEPEEAPAAAPSARQESPDGPPRTRTSPLARRLAREYGLDIDQIQGSGPKGRVVRADIESAAAQQQPDSAAEKPAAAPAAQRTGPPEFDDGRDSEEITLSNVRKVIARRLGQSKRDAPHFYLRRKIDAEALKTFRAEINTQLGEGGGKVSVNDLIVKASATVLRRHPAVNSSWVDEKLLRHRRINIGVAVAVEEGLVVPVLQDTDRTSLSDIAARTRELAGKARDGKLAPQDMSGGTFSVSNLGMYGVDSFSAVLNPPEAAILAVGAMRQEPVVHEGAVVPRHTVSLELSVDHRAVDGATAAEFLKDLAEVLENPMRIVV